MKRVLRLIFAIAVMTVLFAVNAFGAGFFVIPSAGAETILRDIPTTYVYTPDWMNKKKTADSEETSLKTDDSQNNDEDSEQNESDQAEDSAEGETAADSTEDGTTEEEEENAESAAQTRTTPVATNNRVICIDAGHQSKANNSQEPIGPGASETKAKVAGGTTGVSTGVPEYKLTLDVALKLQSELQSRGYTVVMCRTSNDVNISNAERAEIANNAGAGAFLRLHGNGAGSSAVAGAETLAPSSSNPYCSGIASQSQALSKAVLDGLCAATGAKNRGVKIADNMSGINWSRVPVTIVEMGYMTNPAEDVSMQDPSYQAKLAKGMADGVDAFFGL